MSKGTGDRNDIRLTEHEGMLLALAFREQPVTAYHLFRLIGESPVTSINASKGQVYPAIRRLKERGLIESRKVAGDGRNAEELVVTEAGCRAVTNWTLTIGEAHIVLDDPLRSRVLSFDLLSRSQQIEWIVNAKALVKKRRETLDAFNSTVTLPFQELAYRSAAGALNAKMEWLDELLYAIAAPAPQA
jgi:DNA-binding PadR family transcriptional regulator